MRSPASTSAAVGRRYLHTITGIVHHKNYDVIHVQHSTHFLPALRRAAPRALIVLHTHAEWFPQSAARVLAARLQAADIVLAPSAYTVRRISAYVPTIAAKAVRLPNGVAVDRLDAARTSRQGLVVLYVGAVSAHKGIHDLVAASTTVARQVPGAELRIAGAPGSYPIEECFPMNDRDRLASLRPWWRPDYDTWLAQSLPADIAPRVRFLGPVPSIYAPPESGLVSEYLGADVVVCPSLCDEAFGLPALEASAAGIPVIATRAGGQAEIVIDGETGFLIDRGDRAALADRLTALLTNPALRARLGQRGRERAQAEYDVPVVAARLTEIYRSGLTAREEAERDSAESTGESTRRSGAHR